MELDIIKQQTTWNDAATSINTNFAKVKQAIQLLESTGNSGLDEESLVKFLEENGYATEAYVATQISGILGGASSAYDTLKEIESILEGHEGRISTLEDKEAMFRWVTDADGTRRIETDYDLASLRTIASGGQAQNGEGGAAGTGTVMAVEVNGEIYDAEDGIVTLPDYPTKDEYDGKMSSLDAKDKAFAEGIAENTQEIEFLKPRVEKNEGDIKDLQVVDKDIKEQLTKIRKITDRLSYDAEQDMLLTPSNFASQKTIASGGVGTEGDGEGGGGTSGTLDSLLDVEIDFSGEAPTEEDRPMLAYDTTDFIWKNRKTMHRHPQGVASSVWTITHNLNKVPNVKVIDSTGNQVYGDVKIENMNIVTVSFGGAFSGIAYLD